MGGRNSQPSRKTSHFYFGDVVRKKSLNKQVICVTNPIINKIEFDEWKEKYDIVNEMNKQSLYVPQGFDYRKIQNQNLNCGGCCGAQAQYEMTYEDVDISLYSELVYRNQRKNYYKQTQLLYMLYRFMEGAKEFQKKGLNVGDIRTKNMLVTRNHEIKMVNIASFPKERTSIDKILEGFDNTTKFYLAPQEIQYIKTKGVAKQVVPNPKTEAWSIGLCVLEAATLESSQQIYEMPGRKINQKILNQRMGQVKKKYPTLYDFLAMIIKNDPSQRMTTGQCWASMRPYSVKITQLQTFKRNPASQNASIRKYQTEGSGRR